MSKKRVLVINLGWEQEPLLHELAGRNVELYGVHSSEDIPLDVGFREVLVCDLRDLTAISAFAEKIQVDAVVSDQCDYSYFAQAVIAEQRGLPGPRIAEAQVATNKLLQRELARREGLTIPNFKLCISTAELREFAVTSGYPIIAKPVDNRGSFGVNKISCPKDIEFAFYDALVNSHSRLVIAEQFIDGVHITIDGYAFRNAGCKSLTLATKVLVGTTRQVAMDILYPGTLDAELTHHALRINESVNARLGFRFGMTHSEYMVTDAGEVYLIESANRGGGVFTSEIIVNAVSGIDLVGEYVDDILGIDHVERFHPPASKQVLLKFFSFRPGRVKTVRFPTSIVDDHNVLKHRLAVKSGDVISKITTDANRHGFLILTGNGDIQAKADRLIAEIEVIYEKE